MTLKSDAQIALKEMFDDIDGVKLDDIKMKGFTVRAGNKLVRLEVVHEEPISIEDEIREEFRIKLRAKLQEIKSRLNDKINDVVNMTNRVRQEAEKKERQLKEKLKTVKAMPNLTWRQVKQGVSVAPGERTDEICFLIRGIYYPKFVNERPLDPVYAKKLIAPVIFFFKTSNGKITEFSTRKPQTLEYFPHYHQQRPDCWGEFKYNRSFSDVQELIDIKNAAEAVLENVNTHSIASSNPRGLPRKSTLMRHVVTKNESDAKKDKVKLTVNQQRQGIAASIRNTAEDVWQV